MNDKKSNTSIWLSFLVALIVLALIAGFIISLMQQVYWLAVLLAGCFLLILDSILFIAEFEKKRKRNFAFPVIICVVGVCTVICGIMLKINPDGFKKFAEENAPSAAMLLFFIVGIGLIWSALTEPARKRSYCTEMVRGVCVDLKVNMSTKKRYRSYAPVYEFYFAGETRRVAESSYTNFGNPTIGEEREIYLDTESLDEFYEPIRAAKMNKMACGLGIVFAAAAVLGLIMMYVVK